MGCTAKSVEAKNAKLLDELLRLFSKSLESNLYNTSTSAPKATILSK